MPHGNKWDICPSQKRFVPRFKDAGSGSFQFCKHWKTAPLSSVALQCMK